MPRVASTSKPRSTSPLATATAFALSLFCTEMKAVPRMGRRVPAPIWLLPKAAAKLVSIPITSPVERISGPSSVSTPANLAKGKTASFTAMCLGVTSRMPISLSVRPTAMRAATLASGTPVTLETNGTVREARGFTSRMKMPRPSRGTANWTFIRPRTPSSRASARACVLIASTVSAASEWGGRQQAESPEWMPASSMCSITPPTMTSVPSATTSTSTSMASGRNWSIRIGASFSSARDLRLSRREASIAVRTNFSRPDSSWTISMARPPRTYDGRTITG